MRQNPIQRLSGPVDVDIAAWKRHCEELGSSASLSQELSVLVFCLGMVGCTREEPWFRAHDSLAPERVRHISSYSDCSATASSSTVPLRAISLQGLSFRLPKGKLILWTYASSCCLGVPQNPQILSRLSSLCQSGPVPLRPGDIVICQVVRHPRLILQCILLCACGSSQQRALLRSNAARP